MIKKMKILLIIIFICISIFIVILINMDKIILINEYYKFINDEETFNQLNIKPEKIIFNDDLAEASTSLGFCNVYFDPDTIIDIIIIILWI